jgi:hypothetical protein
MMDEGAFSFEDVEDGSSPPRVTAPLPGAPSLTYPRPGALFGGSPRPVASGVTRGEKNVKISRIRDWLDEAHNLLMLLWLFPSVYFVESYPCLL